MINTTKSYFRSGVPWVAALMLVAWCLLEALIFTFTLWYTLSEVMSDITGTEINPFIGRVILYSFLVVIIAGSYAALQTWWDAAKTRNYKLIIQMSIVEAFVAAFEIMFLYRDLVDMVTPWITQQTGVRMGFIAVIGFAFGGWMAVRLMTWFLFGVYGTPVLLSFIAGRAIGETMEEHASAAESVPDTSWWQRPLEEFKNEIDWLHEKFRELLEFITLPFLQILASILNFYFVLFISRPIFTLPFKSFKDVSNTRDIIARLFGAGKGE